MKLNNVTYSIEWNHLEVTLEMSAYQALHGFEVQIPYVNHKHLRINRVGKITFPKSNSTVSGLGMPVWHPKVTNPDETEADYVQDFGDYNNTDKDNSNNNAPELNGTWVNQDLIVKFELAKELDDPTNIVDSQVDKDNYARIMSACGNYTMNDEYDKIIIPNDKKPLVITATTKNIVITGKSFLPITNSVNNNSDLSDGVGNHTRSISKCTDVDYLQYESYLEDKKWRKLLELLQKQREEEEETV